MLLKCGSFVRCYEKELRHSDLVFSTFVLHLDKALNLLNSLNAVLPWHHEICDDEINLHVVLEKLGHSNHKLLSVVVKLRVVNPAKGCELLLNYLHTVQLVLRDDNFTRFSQRNIVRSL